MQTAKQAGYKKGDLVMTMHFPAILIANVDSPNPEAEVWGEEHTVMPVPAYDLALMDWARWEPVAKRYGFDGTTHSPAARDAVASARAGLQTA